MNKKHTTASELRSPVSQSGFEAREKQDRKKKPEWEVPPHRGRVQTTPTGAGKLRPATKGSFTHHHKVKSFTKLSSRSRTYNNHKRRGLERAQKKASADEFCLISVKKTKNNTHCAISRLFGDRKTMWTTSGGQTPTIGSKSNGRRKSRYCQRMIFKAATEQLLGFGFKYLVIHCIGRAISKRYIFRNFYRRFRIVLLKDLLAVAHNGCRPRKARRL